MSVLSRFTDIELTNTQLPPISGYLDCPLLSLERALDPVLALIPNLETYIRAAKDSCNKTSLLLTLDESASIYLYTMEWGERSLYRVLNNALRSEDRTALKPWFFYLRLFNNGFIKLPNHKMNLWRGVRTNLTDAFQKNDELTWWSINSCSSSLDVIKKFLGSRGTLFLIEAVNGKSVTDYSRYKNENEFILAHGTRFRVVCNSLEHASGLKIVQLCECTSEVLESMPVLFPSNSTSVPVSSLSSSPALVKKRIVYPNGDVYEGDTLNHLYHGYGVYKWSNGDRYEGMWVKNRREGQGMWIWGEKSTSAGDRYEGQWHLDKKHGQGEYRQANGDIYVGEFKDDKRDGNGIYRIGDRLECYRVTYVQDELRIQSKIESH